MFNLAQSSARMGGRLIIIWKILVIKFPINYFVLSFLFSQECESWQVVCRSHYWDSHQSHWEPVCLLSSYVFVNSCLLSWFAVKRTLPRGGRYNLSRLNYKYKCTWCSLHHSLYNSFSYLPVYMWRQLNKVNQKDDFSELLRLMSAKQMQTDADFDNNRVCDEGFLHFIQNVITASPCWSSDSFARVLVLWCYLFQSPHSIGLFVLIAKIIWFIHNS